MTRKPQIIGDIYSHKHIKNNGDIVDIKIEQVEKNDQFSEGVRYSLSYIRNGRTVVRYDNHAGHQHHKHIRTKRQPYEFVDEWQLIDDFREDLRELGIDLDSA